MSGSHDSSVIEARTSSVELSLSLPSRSFHPAQKVRDAGCQTCRQTPTRPVLCALTLSLRRCHTAIRHSMVRMSIQYPSDLVRINGATGITPTAHRHALMLCPSLAGSAYPTSEAPEAQQVSRTLCDEDLPHCGNLVVLLDA